MVQVAPSWVVDAALYSEMKGGLHPWFTGLAVVGGVYVFGVVGAVYGPLALCVVYVLVNMYSTFMQGGGTKWLKNIKRQSHKIEIYHSRISRIAIIRNKVKNFCFAENFIILIKYGNYN